MGIKIGRLCLLPVASLLILLLAAGCNMAFCGRLAWLSTMDISVHRTPTGSQNGPTQWLEAVTYEKYNAK